MYKGYYIRISKKKLPLFASMQSRLCDKIVLMNRKTPAESLNNMAGSGNRINAKPYSLTSNPSSSRSPNGKS